MRKRFVLVTLIMLGLGLFSQGCAHNIRAKGWGIATPYFSAGNGSIAIVKDNVEIRLDEDTTAEGVTTKDYFKVGDQTTGYEVEMNK